MQQPTSAPLAVDIHDVRKTYGRKVRALRGVDLRVGRGEIFGLLGPNGAGKSTLVKILLTIVRADRADGELLGRHVGHRPTLRQVGYLPENPRFPSHLRGRQVLEFHAALAKVGRRDRKRRAGELLDRVGMADWSRTRVGKYSKGMLQRLGIAQALMNDPQLVFLDEPTDGLDPLGRRSVREMLAELKAAGKTVFINSHLLSELELICDRVAILVRGEVVRQGSIADLTEHTVSYHITVAGNPESCRAEIEQSGARLDGDTIVVRGHDAQAVNELIDLLRGRQILIESVTPHRFSLEDIFIEAVEDEGAHNAATKPVTARPAEREGA